MFNIVELIRKVTNKKGFKALQEELENRGIMKRSVFAMFKSIAENPLIQANIKDKLPPSYNTLYYVARIEDQDVFESAIKGGRISPLSTLEDMKKFSNEYKNGESKKYKSYTPKQPTVNLASIKVEPANFKKHKIQILHLLQELQGLGLIIKFSEEFQPK